MRVSSSIGRNRVSRFRNLPLTTSTINVAMESWFGQMEVRSKAIGSMAKLVVLACSGHLPMKSLMVFGNKTDRLAYVYFDRVMDKICLLSRRLSEWAVWTLTLQICKRNRTARESKCGVMAATISATFLRGWRKDKEFTSGLMGANTQECGQMMRWAGLEHLDGQMAATSKECSKMEWCTDLEIMSGKMAANTRVTTNIIRSTAKERTHTRTEASTEGSGKKACNTVWDAS